MTKIQKLIKVLEITRGLANPSSVPGAEDPKVTAFRKRYGNTPRGPGAEQRQAGERRAERERARWTNGQAAGSMQREHTYSGGRGRPRAHIGDSGAGLDRAPPVA